MYHTWSKVPVEILGPLYLFTMHYWTAYRCNTTWIWGRSFACGDKSNLLVMCVCYVRCCITVSRYAVCKDKDFYPVIVLSVPVSVYSFDIWESSTRRKFLREILYKNIAIIAIQHSKIYFVDTFGDFSHTAEWNSLKSVWQISLYILAWTPHVEGSNYHTGC